jgi:hypothetical protein
MGILRSLLAEPIQQAGTDVVDLGDEKAMDPLAPSLFATQHIGPGDEESRCRFDQHLLVSAMAQIDLGDDAQAALRHICRVTVHTDDVSFARHERDRDANRVAREPTPLAFYQLPLRGHWPA